MEAITGTTWRSMEGVAQDDQIMDVPGFTDILIHCGNTHEHTSGCILVGDSLSPQLPWIIQGCLCQGVPSSGCRELAKGEEVVLEIVCM